jgi:predicted enzyme related to lactoylglutathione lyase
VNAPIVHIEFAGKDGHALEAFYRELFGWDSRRETPGGHDYGRFTPAGGSAVTGGIRHEPEGPAETVVYVRVADVARSAERAQELGGRVRLGPMTHDERIFAIVEDPAGNPVGLLDR